MFKKILIANRGEIACRVAATARRLGIRTVAVYSDADANAKHVQACDEAVHIGPASPKESYLRAERIIEAAKATTRAALNTSPEPFSNIAMSLLGDSVVPVSLWLSWEHPYIFFGVLAVVIVVSLVLIWVLAKFLRQLARRVSGLFATRQPSVRGQ